MDKVTRLTLVLSFENNKLYESLLFPYDEVLIYHRIRVFKTCKRIQEDAGKSNQTKFYPENNSPRVSLLID